MNIEEILNKYLLEDRGISRRHTELNEFHPSSIGVCLRAMYLHKLYPREFDTDTLKIFKVGNLFHEFIQGILKNFGDAEVKVIRKEDNIVIRGKADFLTPEEVLEFKTVKNLEYIFEPSFQHTMQIQTYLNLLKRETGYVVYMEKNSLQIKTFKLKRDPEAYQKVVNIFKTLYKYICNKVTPPATGGPHCQFCLYRNECNIDGGAYY